MRRTPACTALALAASVVGAGCASGTSHPSTGPRTARDAFVAQADTICQRAVDARGGHPFPIASFDPLRPDPAQLPAVADYFARYGRLPATVAALHRLTPPPSEAAPWRSLLDLVDQEAANAAAQQTAARKRDVARFVATAQESRPLGQQIDDAGSRLGFGGSSACRQVFG